MVTKLDHNEISIKPVDERSNLKILIVANSIMGGGAEEASYQLFSTLNEQKGVTAYFCAVNGIESRVLDSNLSDKVFYLNRKHKSGFGSTLITLLRFSNLTKQLNPSHVIANCELPEMLMALTNSFGASIICVEHTTKPWAGRRVLGVFIRFALAMRQVRWVTVNSSQTKIWWTNKKTKFIPNIVETPTSQIKLSQSIKELVFIGRVTQEKQPEMVIKAGLKLGIRTSIFGVGKQLEELERACNRDKRLIKFYGFVPKPFALVTSGALVIVPSEYEGDGLVVVEAILAGAPILLRDNVDLRRFELPDRHYFRTQEDLNQKIKYISGHGLSEFYVTDEKKEKFMKTRSAKEIRIKWIEFLTDTNSRETSIE